MSDSRKQALSALRKAWSGLQNATVRYLGGVLLLLTTGIGCQILSHGVLAPGAFWYTLIAGLGEALIISAVLAILVDPYLKRRLQSESAWGGVFGFLNHRAPESLKDALRDLADCKVFFTRTTWTVEFAWEDRTNDILAVTIEIRSVGRNIGTDAHMFDGESWILASTTSYQSEYLRFALSCPAAIRTIDATGAGLARHTRITEDGSVVVDEAGVTERQSIPSGETFEIVRKAKMYRHANGYIPLHHGRFGENLVIALTGPALNDIDVRVAHPADDGKKKPTERRRTPTVRRANPDTTRFDRVTPGQVTLVSWKMAVREDG